MSDTRIGETRTGDTRLRRGAREPAQSQAAADGSVVAEAVAAATAAVVEGNIAPQPEPVSTIALAQAMPVAPACPVPAALERAPTEKPPAGKPPMADKSPEAAAETAWTVFAEAQSALARGFEKAVVEMTGFSSSGIAATTDAAVALLGARSFAEALEINAALARRGLDTVFEASVRLSEIGAKAIADASRPMLSPYGSGSGALGAG